jgi:hypothetical protein
MKLLLTFLAVSALAGGISACGGGATGDSVSRSAASTASTTTAGAASTPTTSTSTPSTTSPSVGAGGDSNPKPEGSSTTSQAKRYPHGDDSIQTYGKPAVQADREAVSAAVRRYYAAVAAGDGSVACSLLSSGLSKSIVQSFGRSPALRTKDCAGILALLFKHRPGRSSASLAAVQVTAVRLNGDRGFALLHSKEMPSGEISVDRENGTWKIGALIGGALP